MFLDISRQRVTEKTISLLFGPLLYSSTTPTHTLLADLAEAADVQGKIRGMREGQHLNNTEDRSVLHMALRAAPDDEGFQGAIRLPFDFERYQYISADPWSSHLRAVWCCAAFANCAVDGKNVVPAVHQVLDAIRAFSDDVRSGKLTGATGKPLSSVIAIGIGGRYVHDGIGVGWLALPGTALHRLLHSAGSD